MPSRRVRVPRAYAPFIPSRARYHCENCKARLFPGDQIDRRTEAPLPGAKGNPVLLSSYNASHPDEKFAWCFSCKTWVTAERLDPVAIIEMYIKRRGVVSRIA